MEAKAAARVGRQDISREESAGCNNIGDIELTPQRGLMVVGGWGFYRI